jgi:hypothetical protein
MRHADCIRCRRRFVQHRRGHVFCSRRCRDRGPRTAIDVEAVERLFDPDRDPTERVREDDWFPESLDSGWRDIYAVDTVRARRNWFEALEDDGKL